MSTRVADQVMSVIEIFLGADPPVRLRGWDGSVAGPSDSVIDVTIHSRRALRDLLWTPNELGLARAYVRGDLQVNGSVFDLLALRDLVVDRDPEARLALTPREWVGVAGLAARLGALGPPLAPPEEEARPRGRVHSLARDRAVVSHHYDVGNDFYRLILGPTMTYSCAYFPEESTSLDEAQVAKYELICRKLGLEPGQRLLDVGCGWGGMVMHAAAHHGVEAVGITISREQYARARERVEEAGLADRVEIRLCDYRDLDVGGLDARPFDAISSIGMFEHVGLEKLHEYIAALGRMVRPGGRILNHAISRPAGESGNDPDSFLARYVFPDGHLNEVGRVISAFQDHGLECRDVESLREHYGRTLRAWVANLEDRWDEAVALVGGPRARIWRLYMAGSAVGFEAGRINVHQVLFTATTAEGHSGMPPTRAGFAAIDAPVPA